MSKKTVYVTNDTDSIGGIIDSSESKKKLRKIVRDHIIYDMVGDCIYDAIEKGVSLTSAQELWDYLKAQEMNTYTVYECFLEPLGSNFDFAYSDTFAKKVWKAYKTAYEEEAENYNSTEKELRDERIYQYRELYKEFGGLPPDEIETE